MNRDSRFWDWIADRYASQPVSDEDAYRIKLEATRRHLAPDSRVLEFGCGTGSTALAHAPFVGRIEAIDFSARMIEIAREKAKAQGLDNVSFAQADIMTLDAPDQTYDAVLGLNVLHLVNERDAVVAKVFRLLKPGGVFVTSTACLGDTMAIVMKLAERVVVPVGRLFGRLPSLRVFSTRELMNSLTGPGFEVVHGWRPDEGAFAAVFVIVRKPG
jgi:ubiquinone/menaquinone biosynthesis C-methylase UbiE